MVNYFDTLTRVLERPPTEQELGMFMEMKREQEGWKSGKLKIKEQQETTKPMREPKQPKKINDRSLYRWPRRASMRAKMVNRMLKDNITIKNIAYYLDTTEGQVMKDITTWGLPQAKNK
jgi:hypothetical protein